VRIQQNKQDLAANPERIEQSYSNMYVTPTFVKKKRKEKKNDKTMRIL
jgi:hypothetical protein